MRGVHACLLARSADAKLGGRRRGQVPLAKWPKGASHDWYLAHAPHAKHDAISKNAFAERR